MLKRKGVDLALRAKRAAKHWIPVLLLALSLLSLAFLLSGCGVETDESLTGKKDAVQNQEGTSDRQRVGERTRNDNQDSARIRLIPAEVIGVVDGDTLRVRIGTEEEKVRLIGVNTPEISHSGLGIQEQPYGREAFEYTKKRLEGRQIHLEFDVGERDKYGRLLAYVWLERPANDNEDEVRTKMFNAELLLNGYSQVMTVPPNVKYAELFIELEREARQREKGLWGMTAGPNTSNSQPGDAGSGMPAYIGNTSSKKFHYLDCPWAQKVSPKNRVEFGSREEALEAGYQPCQSCRP